MYLKISFVVSILNYVDLKYLIEVYTNYFCSYNLSSISFGSLVSSYAYLYT